MCPRRPRPKRGPKALRIAIDACSPWTFESLARDTDWARFEASLYEHSQRRSARAITGLYLDVKAQLDNVHELAGLVRLGETLGCDGVRFGALRVSRRQRETPRRDIASPDHPLHTSLLETLRDPVFDRDVCDLGALAPLRERAFSVSLPSDEESFTSGARCIDRCQSLLSVGDAARCCALSAHGRWRFPEWLDLLILEAVAYESLGMLTQATYRYREHLRKRPGDAHTMVALGVALVETGQTRRGVRMLVSAATTTREPAMHDMLASYLSRLIDARRTG